ncbi:uncharacterized protein B0H18DRAFT_971426 [Fomitopsis serialis]|uniref:uncharacterized protein n=1 Tax=Fomitopsis serialis TaxID=139415 RepID=UPI0020071F69|nr:uncharacterized protein B0H18DRAFT_971426 [Neoantrodia serialis]KAH9937609.1 hypothetical protein B0H18DRAFT_971426 [Neoantrodia serialis]
MAQTSPSAQLSKHPAPNIPSANGPSNVTQFTPRKEFIRDQRVISSFALLALSGANLVRLYSFPGLVISALRRLFDQQDLIVSVREHTHKHFFEFALDRRPWASPKSVESEKLIIAILGAVFQCGYSFLSMIDYGREPDDRVAIAFSKPVALSAPVTVGQVASSSTVVLPQPSRAPFAISFVSPSVLRVVDPPLASTPAIIQAVRGSWPLGVVSEKKLGDATYQFKLKGYKFFQEDNFAADSLHQILTLLSTLDSHAFTLLTSLTLTNRSRKQDLWIFTGPAEGPHSGESAQSSPAGSSMELKAENSPYGAQTSNEKLAPVASTSRLSTLPAVSSPLNPTVAKALGNTLRKASPKVNIPLAFMDDVDSATNSPVDNKQHPFSSSMGSVDMTGIGSGRGKGGERLSRSPELLYMTTGVPGNGYIQGHRDELNPWNIVPSSQLPPTLPYPAFVQDPNTPRSPPPQDAVPPLSHSRNASPYLTPQVQSPEPTQASRQDYFGGNGSSPDRSQDSVRRDKDGSPRDAPDTPRTPTPPLLPSAVFRDSALSITTGRTSYEIPIQWTGRDPEPGRTTLAWIKEEDEGAKQRQPTPELKERPREQPRPRMERTSTGPMSLGAWAPAPKDERRAHDVVISMLPPTIREQPSQEHDERGQFTSRGKSKLATTETDTRETSKSPDSTTSGGQSGTTTTSRRRRSPTRRDTDGWVLVNIDRGDRKDKTSSTGRQTHSVSPTRRTKSPTLGPPTQRPTPHKRSSSDSRVQRSPQPQEGAPVASMSAAAKAIVIIDAVGAKEKEQEKSSNSGFRKMFSKSREKGSKG